MKCTNCKKGVLSSSLIDNLFKAHTCSECAGNWILIEDYVDWKNHNPEFQFTIEATAEIEESTMAMLCPETGIIMRKIRLTANTSLRINYSASAGAVWLDKGKWEHIKQQGIADSLDTVVTSRWQNNIRLESAKDSFSTIYGNKFGQESYSKVREFREWLNSHPRKADLRAYLMADHPYSASK